VNSPKAAPVVPREDPEGAELDRQCQPLARRAQQRHRQQPAQRGLHQDDGRADHQPAVPVGPFPQRHGPDHEPDKREHADMDEREEIRRGEKRRDEPEANGRDPGAASEHWNEDQQRDREPAQPAVQHPQIRMAEQTWLDHGHPDPRDHRRGVGMDHPRELVQRREAARLELGEPEQDEQCQASGEADEERLVSCACGAGPRKLARGKLSNRTHRRHPCWNLPRP
jgi:hypothetical protein